MNALKASLKAHVPSVYKMLARLKDSLVSERWGNYYDASYASLHEPEKCLLELVTEIPSHVTRFLNVGCGAGRDFIPFDGKLDLWGIDIVPLDRIRWVRDFKRLRYERMKAQELTAILEQGGEDLTHTLVYTQGTLMYLNQEEQRRFVDACKKRGCTNFIIQEFSVDSKISPKDKLQISTEGFSKRLFRGEGEELPTYVSFR